MGKKRGLKIQQKCLIENQITEVLELKKDKFPTFLKDPLSVVELDEMWHYIWNKETKCWIWLAICRTTKLILGFATGSRGYKTGLILWNKIKNFTDKFTTFNTDNWDAYTKFLPPNQHYVGKDETYTIEGYNGNFRDDLRRLTRKTKAYSKSQEMLDASLYLYIYNHNAKKLNWLKGIKGF
jgi:insertion element IS1 protein InsB